MKKLLLSACAVFTAVASIAQVTILSEDFESGMPAGWTQMTQSGGAGFAISTGYTSPDWDVPGHTSFILSNDDACNCNTLERLMTPAMDLSTVPAALMTFDIFYDAKWGSIGKIQASNDNGVTWVDILTPATNAVWVDGVSLDLAAFIGDTSVMIGFLHDDGGVWADGLAIDNVLIASPAAISVELASLNVNDFIIGATNTDVEISIFNAGTDIINDLDFTWSDGTNTYTDNLTSLAIPSFATQTLTHTIPLNIASGSSVTLDVNIALVGDADTTDNSISMLVEALTFSPVNRVVIEEGTGTWCGWCPRGTVAMEYMQNTYADFIGIAVHNGDPMTVAAYNSGAGITGFPGMNVDRELLGEGVSTAAMEGHYLNRINETVFADATILSNSLNSITGEATIEVEAHFAKNLNGAYKIAVVVVEDSVHGTGSAWGQSNYYSGGGNGTLTGAGHDWHNEPGTVPASAMWYDHVGIKLVGGYTGNGSIIPTTIAADDIYTHTFTTNIASVAQEYKNISFVMLLLDPNGVIINADKMHANTFIGIDEVELEVSTFPNPTQGLVTIKLGNNTASNLDVNLYNVVGELVYSKNYRVAGSNSAINLDLSNLPKGVYNAVLNAEGNTAQETIIIQ